MRWSPRRDCRSPIMKYVFVCEECKIVTEVDRPVSLAGEDEGCPVCGEDMRRLYFPPALLNRQKPGSVRVAMDRGLKQADGKASVYKALHDAEQVGGDRWRKVRSETLSSELKQMQTHKGVM